MITVHQSNTEALWRPTVPLIVLERVPEPVLRSVWLGLRWLTALVPYHMGGFKPRDLIDLAGVSDSHIHRYLTTLVEREVVWIMTEADSPFPHRLHGGAVKSARYGLKLDELERLSIELYPSYIARYTQRYPGPKTDKPWQTPLFDMSPHVSIGDMQPDNQATHVPIGDIPMSPIGTWVADADATHVPVGDMQQSEQPVHVPVGDMQQSEQPVHVPVGDMQTTINGHVPNRDMQTGGNDTHAPIGDMAMSPIGACANVFNLQEEEREKRERRSRARAQPLFEIAKTAISRTKLLKKHVYPHQSHSSQHIRSGFEAHHCWHIRSTFGGNVLETRRAPQM